MCCSTAMRLTAGRPQGTQIRRHHTPIRAKGKGHSALEPRLEVAGSQAEKGEAAVLCSWGLTGQPPTNPGQGPWSHRLATGTHSSVRCEQGSPPLFSIQLTQGLSPGRCRHGGSGHSLWAPFLGTVVMSGIPGPAH